MPLEIPRSLDDLTPEWLTAALCEGRAPSGGRVTRRRVEPIGEGVGFVGQLARLHLEYAPARQAGPATVIAKLPAAASGNRAMVELIQGYEREVGFYQRLAAKCALATPRCYYASMDPDPRLDTRDRNRVYAERLPIRLQAWLMPLALWDAGRSRRRYALLLEDLAPARNGDQVRGCLFEEARRALRGLAGLHAGFWGDPDLDRAGWLPMPNWVPRGIRANHRRYRRRFFREHGAGLPEHFAAAIAWVERHLERLLDQLSKPPRTLVHGDYRLDNLFFEGDSMWAIDWQTATRGRGALDLAYFVAGNVTAELGEGDERGLVQAYHEELTARGVSGYALDTCLREYDLAKLLLAYGAVTVDDVLEIGGERGDALIQSVRARLFQRIPAGPWDRLLG